MDMVMTNSMAPSATMSTAMLMTGTATAVGATAKATSISMGDTGGCKLSMLLNWHTIDACFLSSAFHIRSGFTFFLSCLASFLLVISLEFLRRCQRNLDRSLRSSNAVLRNEEYILQEETEEKLLSTGRGRETLIQRYNGTTAVVVLEQLFRGFIHTVQFAVSYCIMLLFMYSNGYIIISILLGALVGFALFTRDTVINNQQNKSNDVGEQENICC